MRAVEHAIPNTDDEPPEKWYVYPLVGTERVDTRLAQSVGGSVISLQLLGSPSETLRVQADLIIEMLSRYGIASR